MKVIGHWSVSSFVKILLDVSCYFTAIVLVLASMVLGFTIFSSLGDKGTLGVPVFVEMDPQAYTVASPSLGIEPAQVRIQDIRANLTFPARRSTFLFGTVSTLIIALALALWVLTQLRHVFRTFRDGQPFAAENAKRIRQLGFAVIVGELARAGVTYLGNYYTMTHFAGNGIRFTAPFDLSLMAVFHGLIILIIAEVFKTGSRLEQEQSLTI